MMSVLFYGKRKGSGKHMTTLQKRGVAFLLVSPAALLLTWHFTRNWLRHIATTESNPNQNAMLVAGLINVIAFVMSMALFGYGLDCLWKDFKSRK